MTNREIDFMLNVVFFIGKGITYVLFMAALVKYIIS